MQAEYVTGAGLDEILTMERAGPKYFYHYDGLGSVTELTDKYGVVKENYTYDPYGMPSITNSAVGNPYRFTGREFDEESGIYHYRARQYDPKIGRFLQRDPIGYYDSMNLFAYVNNNPVNYKDPHGEYLVYVGGVVVFIVVGGTVASFLYLFDRKAERSGLKAAREEMDRAESDDDFIEAYDKFCESRSDLMTSPEVQIGIQVVGVANDYGQGPIEALPAIIAEIINQILNRKKK